MPSSSVSAGQGRDRGQAEPPHTSHGSFASSWSKCWISAQHGTRGPQPGSEGSQPQRGVLTQSLSRTAEPSLPADNMDESWCRKHALSSEALRLAGIVRAELLEVMQRIELPVSPPAFGTDTNVLNIQRALISGYFLKVGWGLRGMRGTAGQRHSPPSRSPGSPGHRRLRQLRDADAQARGPPALRLLLLAATAPPAPAPLGPLPRVHHLAGQLPPCGVGDPAPNVST